MERVNMVHASCRDKQLSILITYTYVPFLVTTTTGKEKYDKDGKENLFKYVQVTSKTQ
jgi:hypothetical protein